jgi:hypothetical protein
MLERKEGVERGDPTGVGEEEESSREREEAGTLNGWRARALAAPQLWRERGTTTEHLRPPLPLLSRRPGIDTRERQRSI